MILGFAGGLTPSGESLEILQLFFKPIHRYPWRNFCNPHLQVHRFITLVIIWTKDNYAATEHNISRRYNLLLKADLEGPTLIDCTARPRSS